jgi:hypothetical protein
MCDAAAAQVKTHGAIERILSDFCRLHFAKSNRMFEGRTSKVAFPLLATCIRSSMDVSELIRQTALRTAGATFYDLAARVKHEFAMADKIRRACGGVAAAAASLNWMDELQSTINPMQALYGNVGNPFTNWSSTVPGLHSQVIGGLQSPVAPSFAEWQRSTGITYFQAARELQSRLFDYLESPMTKLLRETERLQELFHSIAEQFSDDVFIELELHLIDRGWYLSIDLPASVVCDLADLHDEQKFEDIERSLRNFYRRKIDFVEPDILAVFPQRARILKLAFAAHRRREYALSVPVLLTQADGISAELWSENFFRTRRSNRQIDRMLEKDDLSLSGTVLRHLYKQGSLRAPFRPKTPPKRFNRHAILHGMSLDYDTEENSLRCIALLEFLMSLQPVFVPQTSPPLN